MISLMLSGSIAKTPATRTTAKGPPYTMVTLKVQTPDGDLFPTVFAFDPLAGTLAELAKGDAITVVGTGKIGTYEAKDGSGTRASLSITASRIVALVDHQTPPRSKGNGPRRRMSDTQIGPPDLPPIEAYNDPIPF